MPTPKKQIHLPYDPDKALGVSERLANIEAILRVVVPPFAIQMSANKKRGFKARQRNAAHAAGLDIDTFLAMAGNVDACPPCLHQEHRTQFTPLFSKWGNG